MKWVREGQLYDTDTAELLCKYETVDPWEPTQITLKCLYRALRLYYNPYFTCIETKGIKHSIEVMGKDCAQSLVENLDDVDLYTKIFGPPDEGLKEE